MESRFNKSYNSQIYVSSLNQKLTFVKNTHLQPDLSGALFVIATSIFLNCLPRYARNYKKAGTEGGLGCPNKKTPANHWSFVYEYFEYFKCESLRHKRRQLLPSLLLKWLDAGELILKLRDRLFLIYALQLLLQSYR